MTDISEKPFVLDMPSVIFGTAGLGNLFIAQPLATNQEIIKEVIARTKGKLVFDSAGKYGAGLALEVLGKCLKNLGIAPDDVIISNKLAWVRTELKTPEPTFEPGVWRDLKHDAIQKISYDGIIECFEQGNKLLGGYIPQMVSVHDPDEYLANAKSPEEDRELFKDILEAYRALEMLKQAGRAKSIGVGAKNWRSIKRIAKEVDLDWVMIANSMTVHSHPRELLGFMKELEDKGVPVINSAVFNAGFLTGGDYYNYKFIDASAPENQGLIKWRNDYFKLCADFGIKPAEAAVQFGLMAPGVKSIALSTSNPERVKENIAMAEVKIPLGFWRGMVEKGLIDAQFFSYTGLSL